MKSIYEVAGIVIMGGGVLFGIWIYNGDKQVAKQKEEQIHNKHVKDSTWAVQVSKEKQEIAKGTWDKSLLHDSSIILDPRSGIIGPYSTAIKQRCQYLVDSIRRIKKIKVTKEPVWKKIKFYIGGDLSNNTAVAIGDIDFMPHGVRNESVSIGISDTTYVQMIRDDVGVCDTFHPKLDAWTTKANSIMDWDFFMGRKILNGGSYNIIVMDSCCASSDDTASFLFKVDFNNSILQKYPKVKQGLLFIDSLFKEQPQLRTNVKFQIILHTYLNQLLQNSNRLN
jgi:hypothetical protein